MKSTSILLALITVIALAVGGLLLSDPAPDQGLDSGGTSAVEQETDKGSLQQNTMAGSLTLEPGDLEETERATVETDEAQAKQSDAEALEALKAKGPFLMGKVVNELGFAVADANVRVTGENPTSALNLFDAFRSRCVRPLALGGKSPTVTCFTPCPALTCWNPSSSIMTPRWAA